MTNESILRADVKRITCIAAGARSAMDTFQRGKCISEDEIVALHDAMEFLMEAESGVEAIDAFNRRCTLSRFYNLSNIHILNAAMWFLTAQKYAEYRPEAVHEILREIRSWCPLLQKLEYMEPLDDREKGEFKALWQFFKESELLAERIAHGEPLPAIALGPVAQET